jgi:lysophospholipase L1-like esterase
VDAIATASYPMVRYSVDGGAYVDARIPAAANTIALAAGLAAGNHTLEVILRSSEINLNRWTPAAGYDAPGNVLRIRGLMIDSGATAAAAAARTYTALVFGDSISEGYYIGNSTRSSQMSDATQAWCWHLAQAMDSEVGVVAYASIGWKRAGTAGSNIPTFHTIGTAASQSWQWMWNGVARSYASEPDYIIVNLGTNDIRNSVSESDVQASATAWLADIRAACPNAIIYVIVPFGQFGAAPLAAAVIAAADSKVKLIDLGAEYSDGLLGATASGTRYSYDSVHPNVVGHLRLAAAASDAVSAAAQLATDVAAVQAAPWAGPNTILGQSATKQVSVRQTGDGRLSVRLVNA